MSARGRERSRLVLVGGGGHARVAADVLIAIEAFEIVGFTSNDEADRIEGCTRLGTDAVLRELLASGVRRAFVAIGDNARRRHACEEMVRMGFELPAVVHPSAVLSTRARVERAAILMPGAIVNTGTRVGVGAVVNTGASVDHDCSIGDYAHVAPGCHLAGSVDVGEGAFLGVGVSVIPGRRIGAWSTVGGGAAVVDDIAPGCVAVGVPARAIARTANVSS